MSTNKAKRDRLKAQALALSHIVLARTDRRCWYCGNHHNLEDRRAWALDHVIPQSAGGLTIPDNLVGACWDCNSTKGSGTVEQLRDILMRRYGMIFTDQQRHYWKSVGVELPIAAPIVFFGETLSGI